jgi:uncharacterized OB-fold protein
MIISTILLCVFLLPASFGASGEIFGAHYLPADPEEDEEVDLFVYVRDPDNEGIERVYLDLSGEEYDMTRYDEDKEVNWTEGVLYHAAVKIKNGGDLNLTFHSRTVNGTISSTETISLFIEEKDKEDTILGLPRTYCLISVIFITLIVIFLTWSYFKGRRMQKEIEHTTGVSGMACSACGAGISPDDEKCPKCGAVFEEEEHICGNCGEVISESDTKCSKCGTKLKKVGDIPEKPPKKKEDPDLKKLKKNIDMTGKTKCKDCGAVYLKKEGQCPECARNS